MKSLKSRLLALLAVVMMLLTVSGPAMAQEWDDGFWWGDLWCWDIDVNLIACSDGGIYEEVDSGMMLTTTGRGGTRKRTRYGHPAVGLPGTGTMGRRSNTL